jgi:tetratricopeptide (TPR) repeat protein
MLAGLETCAPVNRAGRLESCLMVKESHMKTDSIDLTSRCRAYPRRMPLYTLPVWLLLLGFVCPRALSAPASLADIENLMRAGDYEQAEGLSRELLGDDPDNAPVLAILSQIYLTREDGARAVDFAKRAAEVEPDVAEYRLWLARAYLLRASQSTLLSLWYAWKGKGQYEKAVELDPANVETRLELCLYYLLAPGIAGGGRDKARRQADAIEEMDPLFGAYAWASVWEREKDVDKAEEKLMEAVGLDTSSTYQAKYALGYFYQRNNRPADAREVFEQILAASPDDLNAMYQIATSYLLEGEDLDTAESLFKRYLESEPRADQPGLAMAHWRLGTVYELKGRKEEAVDEFGKAVELEPGNKQFRSDLESAMKNQGHSLR